MRSSTSPCYPNSLGTCSEARKYHGELGVRQSSLDRSAVLEFTTTSSSATRTSVGAGTRSSCLSSNVGPVCQVGFNCDLFCSKAHAPGGGTSPGEPQLMKYYSGNTIVVGYYIDMLW